MITPVRIAELAFVQGPMQDGGHASARAWIRSTAGEILAVVKDIPRHELVREIVCNRLAQATELIVPECFVVHTCEKWPFAKPGPFLFGTAFVGLSNYTRAARQNVVGLASGLDNWRGLLRTIGFDTWIGNEDRTAENLVFLGKNDFAIIDHGEAFPQGMNPTSHHKNLLANHLIAANPGVARQELARRVLRECTNFASARMDEIQVASLPEAWKANPEFSECCHLLVDRLNHLPELIEVLFDTGQGQLLMDTSDVI